MKKKARSREVVEAPIEITTTLFEFPILKNLVEKLAAPDEEQFCEFDFASAGLGNLETASIEADISGDMVLSDSYDLVHLSFNTCFYFTCIRKQDDRYRLAWSVSLS